jgi:hypothetical protein
VSSIRLLRIVAESATRVFWVCAQRSAIEFPGFAAAAYFDSNNDERRKQENQRVRRLPV